MTTRAAIPNAIVFDTNFLLLPFTDGTRIDEQVDNLVKGATWLVPSTVLTELDQIASRSKGDIARHAKMARRYAERCTVVPTKLTGDDGVLEVARAHKAIVATNDSTLQEECRKSGLNVLHSRQRGRIAIREA